MHRMAESRVGIRLAISGYVVKESTSLPARAHMFAKCLYETVALSALFGRSIRLVMQSFNIFTFSCQAHHTRIVTFLTPIICFICAIIQYLTQFFYFFEKKILYLRIVYAAILYCWDAEITLPEYTASNTPFWRKPAFSFPFCIFFVGIALYIVLSLSDNKALAVVSSSASPPPARIVDRNITSNIEPNDRFFEGDIISHQDNNVASASAFPALAAGEFSLVSELPWQPVNRAFPSYHLQSSEVEGMIFDYKVFTRNRYTRQEIMNWGAKSKNADDGLASHVHLALERFEKKIPATSPFLADMTERITQKGIGIDKISIQGQMLTKFGVMEIADAVLSDAEGQAACLIFRYHDAIGFTLAGWFCGTAKKPVDRVSLGCFLNRLDLIQAGQDLPLRQFFAAAELRRLQTGYNCASARQPGRKLTWLDYEAPLPALKLSSQKKHNTTQNK